MTDSTQKSWRYDSGIPLEQIARYISTEYAASSANSIFYKALKSYGATGETTPKWTVKDGKDACLKAALSYTYIIWDQSTKQTKADWRQAQIYNPIDLLQQFLLLG